MSDISKDINAKVTADQSDNGWKKNPLSFQIKAGDLEPASAKERQQLVQMRESTTYWKDVRRRLLKNKVAMVAMILLILVAIFAFIGPMLWPYSYEQQIRGSERLAPSLTHPFGTDALGRDMLVRVMMGTRISLLVGLVASVIETLIGGVYGSIAGYVGGKVDNVMMRFAEIIYSIPDMLIIILLSITLRGPVNKLFSVPALSWMARVGPGIIATFIAFALLYWVGMARMVRGQVISLKEMEYVTVAKALGAKGSNIIRRHLLPNSMPIIMVTATMQIPQAIFTESFLSFLGLGVDAPMTSLGSLCSDALKGLQSYPHLLIAPAVMLSLIILSLNLFGDGLRDAIDPRLKD